MSNDTNDTTDTTDNVININTPSDAPVEVVVKQSLITRTKHFVKSHKKPLLAGAGLVALVGASAAAGRATAPTMAYDEVDAPEYEVVDGSIVEESETENA